MPASSAPPFGIVGNLNVDLWVRPVERFPAWDEELIVESSRLAFAGTAGYVIRTGRGLGLDVVVVSAIGDDPFGDFLLATLGALGVDPGGIEVVAGEETCLGLIFVGPAGQRGILTTLGAHATMGLATIQRHDASIAGCAEVMLCGSYLLPRLGPRQIAPYARMLRDRGQFVVFDPSWDPSGWGKETRAATLDLLGAVDCYLPNDTELLHLTGAPDLELAIDQIAPLVPELVVKCGAEGATCVIDGVRDSVEADSIEAVNTIGAGDIFDVGYLYARRQGLSPEARLRFAGALAAMVVAQPGERVYPDAEAVWRYLGEGGHADRGDD